MKQTKILLAVLLAVLLPISITYGQVQKTDKNAAGSVLDTPKGTKPQIQKPTINRKTTKKSEPEVPLTNSRIAFDHAVFDFGTVPNGAQMTHHFPVRNIGLDTLIITKVKAG